MKKIVLFVLACMLVFSGISVFASEEVENGIVYGPEDLAAGTTYGGAKADLSDDGSYVTISTSTNSDPQIHYPYLSTLKENRYMLVKYRAEQDVKAMLWLTLSSPWVVKRFTFEASSDWTYLLLDFSEDAVENGVLFRFDPAEDESAGQVLSYDVAEIAFFSTEEAATKYMENPNPSTPPSEESPETQNPSETQAPSETGTPGTTNPSTGNADSTILFTAVVLIGLAAVAIVVFGRKRVTK